MADSVAQEELANFVTVFEGLLEEVFSGRSVVKLSDALREKFIAAWDEARSGFEDARQWLKGSVNGARGKAKDLVEEAGLSGAQLDLKLSGFFASLERFRKYLEGAADEAMRLLLLCLKWANILLGSLTSINPVFEPIKELKESLEAAVEDSRG